MASIFCFAIGVSVITGFAFCVGFRLGVSSTMDNVLQDESVKRWVKRAWQTGAK